MGTETLLVLLLTSAVAASPASSEHEQSLTLAEALAQARTQRFALQAARSRLAAAQADAAVPGTLWLPRVGATVQAYEATANNSTAAYLGAGGVDLPRVGGTRVGPESQTFAPSPSTLIAVGLRQEVFDFGRTAALQAVADASLEAERGHEEAVRLDVDLAVAEGFFAVEAAHALLRAAENARDRAKLDRDTAAAGVQAGLRKPVDLTRAEADLARVEVDVLRAQAGLAGAQTVLAAVVGSPLRRLDTRGEWPEPASTPPSEEVVQRALAADPAVHSLAAAAAAAQARTRSIAAEQRPDLQLTASVSGRQGGATPSNGPTSSGWIPDTPNWDAGLVLAWPLFDAAVQARVRAQGEREQAARANLDEARAQIAGDAERTRLAAESARQALPALDKAVDAARANNDQADARWRAGMGSDVELAAARALLAEAEVKRALGRFEYARARALLARRMGESL
jgi:outer membrane protein TolC